MSGATTPANPFAQDVEQPLPDPTALVIFGAGGDLAARKLIPAVYNLSLAGLLPDHMRVLGVARRHDVHSFRKTAREAIEAHSRTGFDEAAWKALEPRLEILQGDFSNPELFQALAERLDRDDARMGPAQRVFYLAVAPRFFALIANALAAVGLGAGADPPTRLMIEKPFGRDLESALELNRQVASAFDESQVFRLDHYLGKETVQNLQVLRFANGILEPIWNRRYVDHLQITVAEDLGIGHRAAYYDSAGAIRDVIQNHAMQLLALVAMEAPVRFDADTIRDEKVKLLRSVRRYGPEEVPDYVVRGQYGAGWVGGEEVPAYLDEEDVAADSRTDTYVALRVEVDNWRWAGTPFYVRTGKRLPRRVTEIAVRFRPAPHLPFANADIGDVEPNELVLSVQPDEGASLCLLAKVPGQTMSVRPVQMEFKYGTSFMGDSPRGLRTAAPRRPARRRDAVHPRRRGRGGVADRAADPRASRVRPGPSAYEAGSQGPPEADELLAVRGRSWRQL